MEQPYIKVFIVDDSALVRDILSVGLAKDANIEVVGTAADPFEASEKIPLLKPDVMTLDVEMPKMNGLEFLRRLMPQYPLPVIMVSALTEKGKQLTLDALALGAVDFVTKPKADLINGMDKLLGELVIKIKIAATAKLLSFKPKISSDTQFIHRKQSPNDALSLTAEASQKVIIIGASTGGTEAIKEVVTRFPARTPGIVIIQHMPPGFTRLFSNRLASESVMMAKEAENGDPIVMGRILVAPGGKQLKIYKTASRYCVSVTDDKPYNGHAPSIDIAMKSAAEVVKKDAIGVVLTGMGADGADGLKAIHDNGGRCIAQDEATSVVFGMPFEAFKRGGAEKLIPIHEIAGAIQNIIASKPI